MIDLRRDCIGAEGRDYGKDTRKRFSTRDCETDCYFDMRATAETPIGASAILVRILIWTSGLISLPSTGVREGITDDGLRNRAKQKQHRRETNYGT